MHQFRDGKKMTILNKDFSFYAFSSFLHCVFGALILGLLDVCVPCNLDKPNVAQLSNSPTGTTRIGLLFCPNVYRNATLYANSFCQMKLRILRIKLIEY